MNVLVNIDRERASVVSSETPHFFRRKRGILGLVALLILGIAGWRLFNPPEAAIANAPPPSVGVATPLVRTVTQWDDYVGRFAPSQAVEVRPRVSGAVTAIHFRDGDIVRRGQLLFTIDQRPFLAALAEARAGVASARSALLLAQSDFTRVQRLTGDEAVSASEVDSLRARLQAGQAALAGAQARLQQRALDVEFTQVRAPISGRISDRRIDMGNLVSGGEGSAATLLTTINALDPIYFSFDASEALYLKAQRDREAGKGSTNVEVRLQDEAGYRWKGRLDFTDNGLDPKSGTIRGRATFANPDLFLTPGMFGNMRLAVGGTTRALLVPDLAIQSDQARKTVLVVAQNGIVSAKPVVLGPTIDGLRIIQSGLSANDRVVISGMQMAVPGSSVSPRLGKVLPEANGDVPNAEAPIAAQATFAAR